MVADLHQYDEEQDPDPDLNPHKSEILDLDLHRSGKMDTDLDPLLSDADPQHCFTHNRFK